MRIKETRSLRTQFSKILLSKQNKLRHNFSDLHSQEYVQENLFISPLNSAICPKSFPFLIPNLPNQHIFQHTNLQYYSELLSQCLIFSAESISFVSVCSISPNIPCWCSTSILLPQSQYKNYGQ